MKKPELYTHSDILFDYLFGVLIEEQKKTNELLAKLIAEKEVKNDTPRNDRRRKQTD